MHGTNQPLPLKEVYYRISCFELFLAITKMEGICVESTNYGRLKSDHMLTITVEKLKAFLTSLLVIGYAGLPRQENYWER